MTGCRSGGEGGRSCLSLLLLVDFYLYSFLSSSSGYVRALGGGERAGERRRRVGLVNLSS